MQQDVTLSALDIVIQSLAPFSIFIVNFEHISYLFPSASIVNFELVNVYWDKNVQTFDISSRQKAKEFHGETV